MDRQEILFKLEELTGGCRKTSVFLQPLLRRGKKTDRLNSSL